jgi:hypothetical protein
LECFAWTLKHCWPEATFAAKETERTTKFDCEYFDQPMGRSGFRAARMPGLQIPDARGSQRWIREAVNNKPNVRNHAIKHAMQLLAGEDSDPEILRGRL